MKRVWVTTGLIAGMGGLPLLGAPPNPYRPQDRVINAQPIGAFNDITSHRSRD